MSLDGASWHRSAPVRFWPLVTLLTLLSTTAQAAAVLGRVMTTSTLTRNGEVKVNGRCHGWVDRYHPAKRGPVASWRWVRAGGAVSRTRYPTRREAVVALLAEP